MNMTLQHMAGTNVVNDQVIATDLLIAAKSGIKQYAAALAETADPRVREVLKNQLDYAIDAHARVSTYMMRQGWYHPANLPEQLAIDAQMSQAVMNLPEGLS